MLFRLLKPAMFAFDPETGHRLAIRALSALPLRTSKPAPDGLAITVAGLTFPNPVGVAAGFDKDAEVPDALLSLGFGFTEVGSITPLPQVGNPKPRLFRLVEDKAVINRMGFNNGGGAAALGRLRARAAWPGIVGVNIGANKDSPDRIADYAVMARMMAPFASYLCVNISSPNTPGLRALQDEAALTALIDAVIAARAEAECNWRCSGCAISARRPAAQSRWWAWAASPARSSRGNGSEPGPVWCSSIRRWSMKGRGLARGSCAGWRF